MDSGDGTLPGIDQKNGDTIGRLRGEQKTWLVCDGSVTRAGESRSGVEDLNDVRMDLFYWNQGEIFCIERGLEALAVFEDIFAGVPIGEPKVENFFVMELRCAARAGAEAVDEPREFCKFGRLDDLEATRFFDDPFARSYRCDRRGGVGALADGAVSHRCFSSVHNPHSIIGSGI